MAYNISNIRSLNFAKYSNLIQMHWICLKNEGFYLISHWYIRLEINFLHFLYTFSPTKSSIFAWVKVFPNLVFCMKIQCCLLICFEYWIKKNSNLGIISKKFHKCTTHNIKYSTMVFILDGNSLSSALRRSHTKLCKPQYNCTEEICTA